MAFPVLLDTCVLVPGYLNDTLLWLVAADTYRPLWSAHVLDELHRNLVKLTSEAQADHRHGKSAALPGMGRATVRGGSGPSGRVPA